MKFDYRPLPSEFSLDGFSFRLLARQGDVVLHEKRKLDHSQSHYEVVVVRKRPSEVIFGKRQPARELMPRSEDWGTYGWTPGTLELAWQLFEQKVTERSIGMPRFLLTDAPKGASNALGVSREAADQGRRPLVAHTEEQFQAGTVLPLSSIIDLPVLNPV